MADCYYLGIGGTGSKCVDSYIYTCAAGLGPDNLWIGMVDQDEGNGNVEKAKINIENYQSVRKLLRSPGLNDISKKIDIFKTNIVTPPGQSNWAPLRDTGSTKPSLKSIFDFNALKDEIQDVINCLYHPEEELMLELDEGFRGRPSIGASAILSRVQENEPFWQSIFNSIDAAKSGKQVRIFLVSSIFGGTGASGFPSIARLIRGILDNKGIKEGVHIGGALLLPYFSFPKPPEDEIGVVAYSESFLEQTRGALDYYNRLFEKEKIKTFDQLYLVGWDPLIPLKNFEKGGPNQNNPALLPEIFTALAASKFYTDPQIKDGIYHIARNEEDSFGWQDLPTIDDNDNNIVKRNIAQFTRTALAYREIYYPFLTEKSKKAKNESWLRNTVLRQGMTLNDETDIQFTSILYYFESFLGWIATMVHHSNEGIKNGIDLVDVNQFSQFDSTHHENGVSLSEKLRDQQLKQFGNLISDSKSGNLAKVFLRMNYAKVPKDRAGIGGLIGALYESCKL